MNKEKNKKKAFLWNMIGSSVYSGSSILYLMIVSRICGVETAGFFSLCYATAQLLLTVGRYGMRTYQATDLQARFTFREYSASRVLTCVLMMAGGLLYGMFSFIGDRIIICIFIIMMKMIDAVEDVYHGNLQQIYHVEEMGKLLAARNLYSVIVFTGALMITKDLLATCVFTAISSLVLCLLINQITVSRLMRESGAASGNCRWNRLGRLLMICTPLFAGTFLSLLLYNVPKYAMAAVMTDEYQTYYSVLFMPSFVITLMCEFVFKPTITTIAGLWWEKKLKEFRRYVLRIIVFIVGADLFIVAAGHLIGRRLLELIYAVNLEPYQSHFIILLIGGGIGAEVYMIYNILIAIRQGNCILPVYAVTALLTILPSRKMVAVWEVRGACLNYLLSCSILFVLFGIILIIQYRNRIHASDVYSHFD